MTQDDAPKPLDPLLQGFIDRVIVPALVRRWQQEHGMGTFPTDTTASTPSQTPGTSGTPIEPCYGTDGKMEQIITNLRLQLDAQQRDIAQLLKQIAELRAEAERGQPVPEGFLQEPLVSGWFSVRLYNCLTAAGCKTVGDIVKLYPRDARYIKNFGKMSMRELRTWLASHNLHLAGESAPDRSTS